jgi:glyoxylase-like metal-dependent hydrolase (beta-lactamase superfamily II)
MHAPAPHRTAPRSKLAPFALALSLAIGGIALTAQPNTAQAAAPQLKTQAPGWYRIMVGSAEVTALSDGTVDLPVDKLLHTSQARIAKGLKDNFQKVPVETSVNAFLVNTGERLVLIDTGAGTLFGPTLGKLAAQIKAAGYQPEQVDDILITHMHPDHVGGLVADGQRVFPNATVHADKMDADYWLSEDKMNAAPAEAKSFFQGAMTSLNPYVKADRFKPFDHDAEVVPGIRTDATHGHTPGHTVYMLESQGQRIAFIGDLIHVAAVQLESPEVTINFDTDQAKAAKARATTFAQLAKDGSLVAPSHFSFPGLGHLRKAGKGWVWVPVNYSSQVR